MGDPSNGGGGADGGEGREFEWAAVLLIRTRGEKIRIPVNKDWEDDSLGQRLLRWDPPLRVGDGIKK
jgi:hypothetical protein